MNEKKEQKPSNKETKKKIAKILIDVGIIKVGFCGTILIDVTHGGIGRIRCHEEILK